MHLHRLYTYDHFCAIVFLFFINSLSLALCGCCGSGFGLAYLCLISVASVFLLVLVKRQIDIAFHNGNHFCWKILRNFVATNALNKMARKRLRTRLVSESYRNLSRIHCFYSKWLCFCKSIGIILLHVHDCHMHFHSCQFELSSFRCILVRSCCSVLCMLNGT